MRATTRVPWLHSNRLCDLQAYLRVADRMQNVGISSKQQGLGLTLLHRFLDQCRIETPNNVHISISDLTSVSFDTAVEAWNKICVCAQWSRSYLQRVRTLLSRTLEALDQPQLAFAINRNRINPTIWKSASKT